VEKVKDENPYTFSSSHVDNLVENREWDKLESYVITFIPSLTPLESHPMLFLRIRMSRVADLIDQKKFIVAEEYFQNYMRNTFQDIIDQGLDALRNASIDELSDGLNHINECLANKKRYSLATEFRFPFIILTFHLCLQLQSLVHRQCNDQDCGKRLYEAVFA
jgi:hypothetical protein